MYLVYLMGINFDSWHNTHMYLYRMHFVVHSNGWCTWRFIWSEFRDATFQEMYWFQEFCLVQKSRGKYSFSWNLWAFQKILTKLTGIFITSSCFKNFKVFSFITVQYAEFLLMDSIIQYWKKTSVICYSSLYFSCCICMIMIGK